MQEFVSKASRACALLGGLCLVTIIVLTVAEIVFRQLTGRSIGPVHEVSGYLFAASMSLSLAYAFEKRAHIRIDIVYSALPERLRSFADLLALAALVFFAGVLLTRGWVVFAASWKAASRSNSTLGLPLIIPQGVWLAGLALFFAVLVYYCFVAAVAVAGRKWDWIEAHLSPPDTNEIVDAEVRNVASRNRDRAE